MKIIHCGDLHLDSKMESVLPKEKAKERKNEILMTFVKMVEYARKNWVKVIIIAGDMFDTKNVSAKVRGCVMDAIKGNPGITFLYLRGNHDNENFLDNAKECPENLKFFGDDWTKYEFEDVVVAGAELNGDNYDRIYDSLILDSRRINIVVLHGQENTAGAKNSPDTISIKNLRDKNIDYLALGHIHSYRESRLDARGVYVYCGCLDGRGFDECGTKGFVVLDIENGRLTHEFVPAASRTLYERVVDISGMETTMQIMHRIEDAVSDIDEASLVKVTLTGRVPVEAEKDISYMERYLNDRFYFGRIKDVTKTLINIEDYQFDPTLKGEFVRLVMSSCISEDEKEQIIASGIRALSGEELD